jgi:hypothetical protein
MNKVRPVFVLLGQYFVPSDRILLAVDVVAMNQLDYPSL